MTHLDRETIALLAYGFLEPDVEKRALEHVAACAECRAERDAAARERGAVKAAFEGPAAVKKGWWPMVAGFVLAAAAGWLVMVAVGRDSGMEVEREVFAKRVAPEKPPAGNAWFEPGSMYFFPGSSIRLLSGRARLDRCSREVTTENAVFRPVQSSFEVIRSASDNATTASVLSGQVQVTSKGGVAGLVPDDVVAVLGEGAPVVLAAGTDPQKAVALRRARLGELRQQLSARQAVPVATDPGSPEDIGRWLARQIAAGRKPGKSKALDEEMRGLWERELRRDEATFAEMQVGPARERLIVAYLDARGYSLSAAQRPAWEILRTRAEAALRDHLASRSTKNSLERAVFAARACSGLTADFDRLLTAEQRAAADELAPFFAGWRTDFMPVFRVVVRETEKEKFFELLSKSLTGDEAERSREIVVAMVDGCVAAHREWRGKDDPLGEQIAVLDVLVRARQRLLEEAKLGEGKANFLLADYIAAEEK